MDTHELATGLLRITAREMGITEEELRGVLASTVAEDLALSPEDPNYLAKMCLQYWAGEQWVGPV